MSLEDFPQIKNFSIRDKISLVEHLWNDIRMQSLKVPVPESHKRILKKRLKSLDSESLLTLEQLKDRLEKRIVGNTKKRN